MISVIIPALNEANTIRSVIRRIKNPDLIMEIIVVDDNSDDNTLEIARKEGARVVTSSQRGKGISMREGLLAARYDIIVYLDADILTYPKNVVGLLAEPLLKDEADFVKSTFSRQAGRITQLVAKPLLGIFFPELEKFTQPLSGMIAARKDFLNKVTFENDYGVDVGLLIDAYYNNQRIKEVNIGFIRNDMQSLESLSKMSRQVSATILRKAELLPSRNLETLSNIQAISDEMDLAIRESLQKLKKVLIVDMDVLMKYNYNETLAGYYQAPGAVAVNRPASLQSIRQIATLLKGRSLPELQFIADEIPLADHVVEVVKKLKSNGYICILISNSFDVVTNHIRNKLGFDQAFSNRLIMEDVIATGNVDIPDYFITGQEGGAESFDKSKILSYITAKTGISEKNMIYVGNNVEDIPMLQTSGIGVVTDRAPGTVRMWADAVIPAGTLKPLLKLGTPSSKNRSTALAVGAAAIAFALTTGYYFYKGSRLRMKYSA